MVNEVTKSLEKGAEEALSWFLSNSMSANADKFQAILARKDKKSTAGISLKISSEEIESGDQIKLVGMFIDHKSSYDEYISTYLTLFRLGRGNFIPPVKHSQISEKLRRPHACAFFSLKKI